MNDRSDTVAAVDWDPDTYVRDATASLESAQTTDAVEQAAVEWLGRNSPLKLKLREVRDRETGMQLNAIRDAYKRRFNQESVLLIEAPVCGAF